MFLSIIRNIYSKAVFINNMFLLSAVNSINQNTLCISFKLVFYTIQNENPNEISEKIDHSQRDYEIRTFGNWWTHCQASTLGYNCFFWEISKLGIKKV